jgi:hypothetical protein
MGWRVVTVPQPQTPCLYSPKPPPNRPPNRPPTPPPQVLPTHSLTWTCSNEAPARQCLITRGLLPLLAEGSARATDTDTTDEILAAAVEHAKRLRYCAKGDCIVALHRIGNASVIKIVGLLFWGGGFRGEKGYGRVRFVGEGDPGPNPSHPHPPTQPP